MALMAMFLLQSFLFVLAISHPFIQQESRIVNGIASSISHYPFIAAIRDKQYDNKDRASISEAWCGGSLIRKEYPAAILTATHCVYHILDGELLVELNASHTQQPPILGISAWTVIYAATHEQFDSYTLDNDIAILFIDADLTNRNDLSTVTIPVAIECCINGDILEIIGYGKTSLAGSYSKTLEHTNLEYIDRTQCNNKLCFWETHSENCEWSYANENNICGLGDHTTPCHGDSGSPLIKKGTTEQVGIVSWGIDCVPTIPTIFTNTAIYHAWINDKLRQFIGADSVQTVTANLPSLHPRETSKMPSIIHHMITTMDISTEPTQNPTNQPTTEPTPYPFAILEVYNPTATPTTETTDIMDDNHNTILLYESDNGEIRRYRSIIVTIFGFSMILCVMSIALFCKRKKNNYEYDTTRMPNEMDVDTEIVGNPYIIRI